MAIFPSLYTANGGLYSATQDNAPYPTDGNPEFVVQHNVALPVPRTYQLIVEGEGFTRDVRYTCNGDDMGVAFPSIFVGNGDVCAFVDVHHTNTVIQIL